MSNDKQPQQQPKPEKPEEIRRYRRVHLIRETFAPWNISSTCDYFAAPQCTIVQSRDFPPGLLVSQEGKEGVARIPWSNIAVAW